MGVALCFWEMYDLFLCVFLLRFFLLVAGLLVLCVALVEGGDDFFGHVVGFVGVEDVVDAAGLAEDEVEAFLLGVGVHERLDGVGEGLEFLLVFFLEGVAEACLQVFDVLLEFL